MEAVSKGRGRRVMGVLVAGNMASLLAAANVVLMLHPEDRISIKRGALLNLLGLAYFSTLFELLNRVVLQTSTGSRWRHKFKLTSGDVMDINNKVVSGVQAALCCLTGVIVCTYSCSRDVVRTSHYMSEAYAWFGAAYFFYDIWSMYEVHVHMVSGPEAKKQDKQRVNGTRATETKRPSFFEYCRYEPVILMHHVFIGGFGFLVIVWLRGGLGDCVFGFMYLMELSTPFVSLRGILSKLKMKSSRAYVINGILMLGTFFVCRVISLPYVCLLYSRAIKMPYFETIKSLPTGCKISICILLIPQLYWFYLMARGAVKVFLGTEQKKHTSLSPMPVQSAGDASARS